jgi:serine/threonine protein kinase
LKIGDFGESKELLYGKTSTPNVGTTEFRAPEMFKGSEPVLYDQAVDGI